jgi:small subunit ribosomal protein S1
MTDHEDFQTLLGQFERQHASKAKRPPQVGDLVHGTVASIGRDHVYVNLGIKSDAIIDVQELKDADGNLTVKVGDPVDMAVSGIDADSGTLLLGSKHGRRMHGAAGLEQAFEQHLPVEGHVTGVTKGGVEVEIAGVRAFCPASQVSLQFVEDLSTYVGQRLAFRITKYEGGKHPNLVISRRELLEEERKAKAAALRARIVPGAVLPGTVTSLQPYGAFVDLGGVEGMVHISELGAGRRVTHPNEVLNAGDEVEATVLSVDLDKRRIALSLDPARQRTAEPSPQAADYAKPSQGMGTLGDLLRQTMTRAEGQGKSKRRP